MLRILSVDTSSYHPAFVYTVPVGIIQAITNQQVGLNVITELIIGYALPGRPIAMMMFKTWGYITMTQALQFTSDFKLGHYMKISHRPMFFCQVAATVIAGTVQLGVQAWLFTHVEDLCNPKQKDGFICPSTTVFGTASIIVRSQFHRGVVPIAYIADSVGCHWSSASLLTGCAVLRARVLLLGRCPSTTYPMGTAQEVQVWIPQVSQLPAYIHRHGQHAARNAPQLCALGPHLLRVQLCHPSSSLWLVVEVQL